MAYTLTSPPASEPVTTDEAKNFLRVDDDLTEDDVLIARLITAARVYSETYQSRQLITATWTLTLDQFPCCPIRLELPPIQSVSSIVYIDPNGDEQNYTTYTLDKKSEPARIVPNYGTAYPATRCEPNAVTVTFVAGYGAASAVPAPTKQAILCLVDHFYSQRSVESIPDGVHHLLMATSPGII